MSLTGCPRCDHHGPDLPTTDAAMLQFHRALHELVRPFENTVHEIAKAFTTPTTQDDYTLAGPPEDPR